MDREGNIVKRITKFDCPERARVTKLGGYPTYIYDEYANYCNCAVIDENGTKWIHSSSRMADLVDGYFVAALVNKGDWTNGDAAIVACGENFPDALSASSLAGKLNAPVILTSGNSLSAEAKTELQRLAPSNVYVIGGEAAVTASTYNAIKRPGF